MADLTPVSTGPAGESIAETYVDTENTTTTEKGVSVKKGATTGTDGTRVESYKIVGDNPLTGAVYKGGAEARSEAVAEGKLATDLFTSYPESVPGRFSGVTKGQAQRATEKAKEYQDQLTSDFFTARSYADAKEGSADITALANKQEEVKLADGRSVTLRRVDNSYFAVGTVRAADGTVTLGELKNGRFKERVIESPAGVAIQEEYKDVPSTVRADNALATQRQTVSDVRIVPADSKANAGTAEASSHLVYNNHDSVSATNTTLLDGDVEHGFTLPDSFDKLLPENQEMAMRGLWTVNGRAMGLGERQQTTDDTTRATQTIGHPDDDLGLAAYVRDRMVDFPHNPKDSVKKAKSEYDAWRTSQGLSAVTDTAAPTADPTKDPVKMYRNPKEYMRFRSGRDGETAEGDKPKAFDQDYARRFESGPSTQRPTQDELWQAAFGRRGDGTDIAKGKEYSDALFNSPPPSEQPHLFSDGDPKLDGVYPAKARRDEVYQASNDRLKQDFDNPLSGLRTREAQLLADIRAVQDSAAGRDPKEVSKQINALGEELKQTRDTIGSLSKLRTDAEAGLRFDMVYNPGNLVNSCGIDPRTGQPRLTASQDEIALAKEKAEKDKVPLNAAGKFYQGFKKDLKSFAGDVQELSGLLTMGTSIGTLASTIHNFDNARDGLRLQREQEAREVRKNRDELNKDYVKEIIMEPFKEMFKNQNEIWVAMRKGEGSLHAKLQKQKEKNQDPGLTEKARIAQANPQRTAQNDEEFIEDEKRKEKASADRQERADSRYTG